MAAKFRDARGWHLRTREGHIIDGGTLEAVEDIRHHMALARDRQRARPGNPPPGPRPRAGKFPRLRSFQQNHHPRSLQGLQARLSASGTRFHSGGLDGELLRHALIAGLRHLEAGARKFTGTRRKPSLPGYKTPYRSKPT